MTTPLFTAALLREGDVVTVRQRARRAAELLGFDTQDQTRIATAVSEVARNAYGYGGGGSARFGLDDQRTPQALVVTVADDGPGVADLDAVLEGRYRSTTGMGVGLLGSRRLMDRFEIDTAPGRGTRVTLAKDRPRAAPPLDRAAVAAVCARLRAEHVDNPLDVLGAQNRELIASLEELGERQREQQRLNRELEETNRGVVALYAELDEKAEQLRRASEMKTRFLSNMSHEFRTPLNSILALSRLLLDRVDGDLTPEQARQVGFVRGSAESLTLLVDDLLDMAKVEAGRVDVRFAPFRVADLFAGLRGSLKPLQRRPQVELVVAPADQLPELVSDEARIAQILRNFISNALKFTLEGEVELSAGLAAGGDGLVFRVRDTGVGISPQDQARIFEEFEQVGGPLQDGAHGTGLGLPLCRSLAALLGGSVGVESAPGRGSTFHLDVPLRPLHAKVATVRDAGPPSPRRRVLVVDDDPAFRYVLRQILTASGGCEVAEAADGEAALASLAERRADLVLLDVQMPRLDGWGVLAHLRAHASLHDVPVLMMTSQVVDEGLRARAAAASGLLDKGAISRLTLAPRVEELLRP